MTYRDKHRPVHKRYFQYCNAIRALNVQIPYKHAHITFIMPMPKSWSKGKKASLEGQYHQQTPDIDNLYKALLDAVFKDDSHVCNVELTKLWGYRGAIVVEKSNVTQQNAI